MRGRGRAARERRRPGATDSCHCRARSRRRRKQEGSRSDFFGASGRCPPGGAAGTNRRACQGGRRRLQRQHRAGAEVRSRHLRRLVRRGGRRGPAGTAGGACRFRRGHGREPRSGHGPPLRDQRLHRPPAQGSCRSVEDRGGPSCAQAHAPEQGPPPGTGAGADLRAAQPPHRRGGRTAHRRAQPRPGRPGLRHAPAPGRGSCRVSVGTCSTEASRDFTPAPGDLASFATAGKGAWRC